MRQAVLKPVSPLRPSRIARIESAPGKVVIASINRPQGNTGVHAHTRMLQDGFARAEIPALLQSPFCGKRRWLAMFGLRLAIQPFNKEWAMCWYRHWHQLALEDNLQNHFSEHKISTVIAQCPVSAKAALNVRKRLGASFPIAMVCHFNHSEAQEYRDQGSLKSEKRFQQLLEFERDVIEAVDEVIYVSRWARDVVELERKIEPQCATVIWNGIADTHTPPADRASLNLSPDDLVLINVGTLEARKNQLALIDLFAKVVAAVPNAKLVLVGDGPHRRSIQRKLETLKLTDKVRMLGFRSDVAALLGAADIYIHYATLENCPVSLIEAARAGLPSAAIPAGGVPELQHQLESSLPLDPNDLAASMRALLPVLQSRDLRQRMGLIARANFTKHFTRDAMMRAYLNALHLTPHRPASGGGES